MSFLNTLPEATKTAVVTEVALNLFDEWNASNLDEGDFYADYKIAESSDSVEVKKAFNAHYNLTPEDAEYFDVV